MHLVQNLIEYSFGNVLRLSHTVKHGETIIKLLEWDVGSVLS